MFLELLERPTRFITRIEPVLDELSRRGLLAGGLSLAALLAGCGEGDPVAAPAPNPTAGYPRTLTGKEGDATIAAPPRRVLALGFQRDADTALALGVIPIALPENIIHASKIAPWVEAKLPQPRPELFTVDTGIPFERIAALRPDLILATDSYELAGNHARLSEIAPTLSYLEGPESDAWPDRTRLIGRAFGLEAEADRLIDAVTEQIAAHVRAHPEFAGKTFTRSYAFGGLIQTATRTDAGVIFLEGLGMKLAPSIAELPEADTPGRASVSPERLELLDADIVYATYPDNNPEPIEGSPVFQGLTAVRGGRYISEDAATSSSLFFPSVLSIPYGLDRTVNATAHALRTSSS